MCKLSWSFWKLYSPHISGQRELCTLDHLCNLSWSHSITGSRKIPTAMGKESSEPPTISVTCHDFHQTTGSSPEPWTKGALNPQSFLFHFKISLATGTSPQSRTKGTQVLIFISVKHVKQEPQWSSTKISFTLFLTDFLGDCSPRAMEIY